MRRVKCLSCQRRPLPDESLDQWWLISGAVFCPSCARELEQKLYQSGEREPIFGVPLTQALQRRKDRGRVRSMAPERPLEAESC